MFKNLPLNSGQVNAGPTYTLWNTNKDGGWDKYSAMTTDNDKLEEIACDTSDDPDKMMSGIEKELTRIKFVSFGKVKVRNGPKTSKTLDSLQKEKIKCYDEEEAGIERDARIKDIDEKIASNLLTEQRKRFENELNLIKDLKKSKGKAAAVFNLKSKVVGSNKAKQEATILIDHKTKLEVNTPEEIL